MRHTKRPWVVEQHPTRPRKLIMKEDQRIAVIGESTVTEDEAEANAYLIAAAPDYDYAAHLITACAIPDMAGKVLISVEAFQAINAAVAKAEGSET